MVCNPGDWLISGDTDIGRIGWSTKIIIPISAGMFSKKETRVFVMTARLLVVGMAQALETEVSFSVSHLKHGRELV